MRMGFIVKLGLAVVAGSFLFVVFHNMFSF